MPVLRGMNWLLFQNSLLVSAGATALAVMFGLGVALALACSPVRWRRPGLLVAVVGMALPPFVQTSCCIDLLGQTGVWRKWLPLDIYSLGGSVWVLALMFWPLTALMVLGSLKKLSREMIESNPTLEGGGLIRHLLLPFLKPALAISGVITLVLCLNQFGVPAILQTKVYPAEVWLRFNTEFDYQGALKASWLMVLAPLALLWWLRGRDWSWPASAQGNREALRRQLGTFWASSLCALTCVVMALSPGLPLLRMATNPRTWSELSGAVAAGQHAVMNSLVFAAITATVVCLLGLISRRWRGGVAFWSLFLVPGVLTGIGLIYVLNRPATAWVYQGMGIVIIALTLHYLALGWSGARVALAGLDRDLSESARLAGVSGWNLFREVHWPQVSGVLLAVWYAIYLLCLWDVESIVLILPPGGETLAVRIFNLLHYGHNTQVDALCLALLGLAVLPLVICGAFSLTPALSRWERGDRSPRSVGEARMF